MNVTQHNIGGEVIKENETYTLTDNNHLEHLTLSKTELNPGMNTRGHSHDSQEEVYFFNEGIGEMQVGEEKFKVEPGSIVLIPAGKFHRVFNESGKSNLSFVCVFEKYDRSGKEAQYGK